MKILLAILSITLMISCSKWSNDKDKFVDTYKDLLIARMKTTDSISANKLVEKVYQKHGFTKESFKEEYFKYAKDHKEFMAILDTARTRAQREITALSKNKFKLKED